MCATSSRTVLPLTIQLFDLRHSCAIVLLETGTPLKVVADRLGRSNGMLTLHTYSHVTPTWPQNTWLKIANAIFGGQSHKVREAMIMKTLHDCENWLGGRDSRPR